MTHFHDLTPYEYNADDLQGVNVGWLSTDHPYPEGDVPPGLLDILKRCCHDVGVHQTRGLHACDFCDDPYAYRENRDLGSAEIWIFSEDRIYAAPTLIVHYIEAHRYLPPQDFIAAVMTGPMPPDRVYLQRLRDLNIDYSDHADLRNRYPDEF